MGRYFGLPCFLEERIPDQAGRKPCGLILCFLGEGAELPLQRWVFGLFEKTQIKHGLPPLRNLAGAQPAFSSPKLAVGRAVI